VAQQEIRFGTDLITFYSGQFLGIGEAASQAQVSAAIEAEPRLYFDRMLDGAVEAGMAGVEFGPDPGGWRAAMAAYGTAQGVSEALKQRGLALTSSYAAGRAILDISGMRDGWQERAEAYLKEHARFVAELGATTIVMGNLPRARFPGADNSPVPAESFESGVPSSVHEILAEQLNYLGRVTAAYGVKIAIHTDAYSVCVRESDISTILRLTDQANVQICLDAGHVTLDGGDAVQILERHLSRIPTMHWKDCIGPRSPYELRGDHQTRHQGMIEYFRVLGTGTIDWHRWMQVLKAGGWSGWAIEEIDLSPKAVAELKSGLNYFAAELSPIYR
jgi:inosose dehydratase